MIIEVRTYTLKQGSREQFHQLVIHESLPLLKKWNINVVAYGPSLHDQNSYFLIRSFVSLDMRQKKEDALYNSDDWHQGPRESILTLIENYTTIVVYKEIINKWMAQDSI